ncbi:hypothetical protein J437_LFUL000954 [Ladona fulva]|uniref:chitinase n=1 Tax=Ladona fulva TaxID=123851 RepID=A0A8K0P1D2_LADFU|nr:hypothetical protein J437_LFUL000954 [Ladona fulva]
MYPETNFYDLICLGFVATMKLCVVLLFGLLLSLAAEAKPKPKDSGKRVVCYFASWAGYRNGQGTFEPENLDPTICTHAIYTFASLDATTAEVVPADAWNDLSSGGGKGFYDRFVRLKSKNPNLKVLLAVGGWNEGSSKYSMMASNPAGRSRFITSAIKLLKEHRFDGMDFVWLYPGSRGGAAADKENYATLLGEMRTAFDQENLMLTAALPAVENILEWGYDIDAVVRNLDFINVLSYDYRGSFDRLTGLQAPLHFQDPLLLDVDGTMKMYINKGVPSDMLVMGIAASGQTFTLSDPNQNGLGAAITGAGQAGKWTQQPGFIGYFEIVEMQKAEPEMWEIKRDTQSQAPYAYNWLLWISYDDEISVKEKADYINENNLGGAMIFTVDVDDFHGESGTIFPLVRTLYNTLVG